MSAWMWLFTAWAADGGFVEPCSAYEADGSERVLEKRQPAARREDGLAHRSGFVERLRFSDRQYLDVLVYCLDRGGRGEEWDLSGVEPGPEARTAALHTLRRRVRWRSNSMVGAMLRSGQDLASDRSDIVVGGATCWITQRGGALSLGCEPTASRAE